MSLALTITGIVLLLAGGASLVRGATSLASTFGVSPLVVGLTVVAFGTSAPELVVNVLGAVQSETELAFGNVLGSNIANIGLVLGAAALIAPVTIQGAVVLREIPLLVLTKAMLVVMCLDPLLKGQAGVLDRADALLLLLMMTVFMYMMARDLLADRQDQLVAQVAELQIAERFSQGSRDVVWIIAGIVLLAGGGQLTIYGGVQLAESLGIPKIIVGMAVIGVGTSMPELVTSIIAAKRREADLCVGNVIGSNLFNSLFVLPTSALVTPILVPDHGLRDVIVSSLFILILIPIFVVGKASMGRSAGALLLSCYVGYMVYATLSA